VAAHPRELAAVDTVLTTLMTYAVQHAMDGVVYMVLVPHASGQDVRAVVYHRHAAPAVVSQDRGRGWARCAAYVADCYGVPSMQQCLQDQYLAADMIDGYDVAWFHWPLVSGVDAPYGKVAVDVPARACTLSTCLPTCTCCSTPIEHATHAARPSGSRPRRAR
jgi:hypothetical protein